MLTPSVLLNHTDLDTQFDPQSVVQFGVVVDVRGKELVLFSAQGSSGDGARTRVVVKDHVPHFLQTDALVRFYLRSAETGGIQVHFDIPFQGTINSARDDNFIIKESSKSDRTLSQATVHAASDLTGTNGLKVGSEVYGFKTRRTDGQWRATYIFGHQITSHEVLYRRLSCSKSVGRFKLQVAELRSLLHHTFIKKNRLPSAIRKQWLRHIVPGIMASVEEFVIHFPREVMRIVVHTLGGRKLMGTAWQPDLTLSSVLRHWSQVRKVVQDAVRQNPKTAENPQATADISDSDNAAASHLFELQLNSENVAKATGPWWMQLLERHSRTCTRDMWVCQKGVLSSFNIFEKLFAMKRVNGQDFKQRLEDMVLDERRDYDWVRSSRSDDTNDYGGGSKNNNTNDKPALHFQYTCIDKTSVYIPCTVPVLTQFALLYYGLRCVFAHGDPDQTVKMGVLNALRSLGNFSADKLKHKDLLDENTARTIQQDVRLLLAEVDEHGRDTEIDVRSVVNMVNFCEAYVEALFACMRRCVLHRLAKPQHNEPLIGEEAEKVNRKKNRRMHCDKCCNDHGCLNCMCLYCGERMAHADLANHQGRAKLPKTATEWWKPRAGVSDVCKQKFADETADAKQQEEQLRRKLDKMLNNCEKCQQRRHSGPDESLEGDSRLLTSGAAVGGDDGSGRSTNAGEGCKAGCAKSDGENACDDHDKDGPTYSSSCVVVEDCAASHRRPTESIRRQPAFVATSAAETSQWWRTPQVTRTNSIPSSMRTLRTLPCFSVADPKTYPVCPNKNCTFAHSEKEWNPDFGSLIGPHHLWTWERAKSVALERRLANAKPRQRACCFQLIRKNCPVEGCRDAHDNDEFEMGTYPSWHAAQHAAVGFLGSIGIKLQAEEKNRLRIALNKNSKACRHFVQNKGYCERRSLCTFAHNAKQCTTDWAQECRKLGHPNFPAEQEARETQRREELERVNKADERRRLTQPKSGDAHELSGLLSPGDPAEYKERLPQLQQHLQEVVEALAVSAAVLFGSVLECDAVYFCTLCIESVTQSRRPCKRINVYHLRARCSRNKSATHPIRMHSTSSISRSMNY